MAWKRARKGLTKTEEVSVFGEMRRVQGGGSTFQAIQRCEPGLRWVRTQSKLEENDALEDQKDDLQWERGIVSPARHRRGIRAFTAVLDTKRERGRDRIKSTEEGTENSRK